MTVSAVESFEWLPDPPPRGFSLWPGEVEVFRAKPELTVDQWADGERHIEISPLPGPMDMTVTPQLKGLMFLYSQEYLREMFLAGGSQSAKTDFMQSCWGWVAVHQPGPTLVAMQDRDTGTETVNDRLIPMIKGTPSLRRLMTGNQDDITARRIRLINGMRSYLAWAQSEGRLASKPARYGFLDEVDLWPESAIRKAHARFRAFEDSYKVIEACTASVETGRIWQAQKLAQVLLDFHVVCPYCKESHVLEFANVQYGQEIVDPAALSEAGSAWYVCPECQMEWDEEDRNEAVRLGAEVHDPPHCWYGWKPRAQKVVHLMPSRVWAHISPLLSRFVPFNKVARAYLMTLVEPTQANLEFFYNDGLGLPVPEDGDEEATSEKELYERRGDYWPELASWRIPQRAVVITADADVQKNRIELLVVAWSEGHESHGVEYKTFFGDTSHDEVWDQLHEWAQEITYEHESGAQLPVAKLGVDMGYRTDMVGKFVRRSRRYIAHKGSNTKGLPLVPRKPSRSKKYKFSFYELGVDTGKDLLSGWLTVTDPGPRCCHWHTGFDFEFFRMLCAERPKREKNKRTGKTEIVWALRTGFVRNEALDVMVGNMAVRQILNPNYRKLAAALELNTQEVDDPGDDQVADGEKTQKQKTRKRRRRSGGSLSRLGQG